MISLLVDKILVKPAQFAFEVFSTVLVGRHRGVAGGGGGDFNGNADTYQKSSRGSGGGGGGYCSPPPTEIFEIFGLYHLRKPIFANFGQSFSCFVAEVFNE